jgi:hypothetical protein
MDRLRKRLPSIKDLVPDGFTLLIATAIVALLLVILLVATLLWGEVAWFTRA